MEPIPIRDNPSYFDLKNQIQKLAMRVNLITQKGEVVPAEDGKLEILFDEDSWKITVPDTSILEDEIATLESENAALQDQINAVDPDYEAETSVGSDGPRTNSATHIFDDSNATRVIVDTWKYEAWVAAISSSSILIRFRKTEISRSVTGYPQQSNIELELPDGPIATNATFIEHTGTVSSGRFAVGEVYYFRTNLQDAKNYVGDPNENIITVDLFSLTINEIPVGTPDPSYPYVTFAKTGGGGTYNNISGATSP